MKTVFFLLAILGLSQAATISQPTLNTRGLSDDLQDFINLIPTDKISEIISNNLNDPQVVQVVEYIFGDDFKKLLTEIGTIPEFKDVVAYLEGAGLPANDWIKALKEYIGMSKFSSAKTSSRGLNDVIQQIKATLPIEEIKALYKDKMANSPAFAELVNKLHSPTFTTLVDKIASITEVKRVAEVLREMGVDIDGFIDLIKSIFGFNKSVRSTRALTDDLQDFIDILPTGEILTIIIENLDDPQVQKVVEYIFGDDLKRLLTEIGTIPEFKDVVAYLEGAGLPANDWIKALKEYIGMSKFSSAKTSSRGLNDVIQQIKATLPIEEIKALYKDKMANSPAFAELVNKLHSPTFTTLVDKIASITEVQRVAEVLRKMGVDIDGFIDLIKSIFGFN